MIRPYLGDLINDHKPIDDDDIGRTEWKSQLVIQNSCISTSEETRTIYSKSELVEIFMGSDTEEVIDALFNTLLQKFQLPQETSNNKGSEYIPESAELLYYHFQKIIIHKVSQLDSKLKSNNKSKK